MAVEGPRSFSFYGWGIVKPIYSGQLVNRDTLI